MTSPRGPVATLRSWKAIGRELGRSERWCRYMTSAPDPLPVFRINRQVCADRGALEAWLRRQREQTIARDRPA
jgi:hypothetical protein